MAWITQPSQALATTLSGCFECALAAMTLVVLFGLVGGYVDRPYLRNFKRTFQNLAVAGVVLQTVALAATIWFSIALQYLQTSQERQAFRSEFSAKREAEVSRREVASLRSAVSDAVSAQQALQDKNQDLRQSLGEANSELAALQTKTGIFQTHSSQRRLSVKDRLALVDALEPFPKQKIQIFSIAGDIEGKNYRDDFVREFERAGWNHEGGNGVVQADFDVDPVGVNVILHQVDASHGHTNRAINALIATLKRLDLFQGGGVFISDQVPDGVVKVAIGKRGTELVSRATPVSPPGIGGARAHR